MNSSRIVAASVLVLAALGCGGSRTVIVQQVAPPPPFQRIVIASVPLENTTADMKASDMLRGELVNRLGARGYMVQPPVETDEKLRAMGVTLGGQIAGIDPKEFHEKLGVDAILSGKILQASSIVTGIYNRRTLEAQVTLTDVRTGVAIWTNREIVHGEDSTHVKYGIDAAIGVAKGVQASNLARESATLANILVGRMPWCPREGDLAWNGIALPAPAAASNAPASTPGAPAPTPMPPH